MMATPVFAPARHIRRSAALLCAVIALAASGPAIFAAPSTELRTVPFSEKYKDHSAVFLLYEIHVELNEDWSYVTRQHKKIRIMKDEAKEMGEIPIPYNRGRQEIIDLKAHTVTPSGEKIGYSFVQDISAYDGYAMYSDHMVRMVTMPAVSVGSVIEYDASVLTKGEYMRDQFWYEADLNAEVPVKDLILTVSVPKKAGVVYRGFGIEHEPEIKDEGTKTVYRWRITDAYDSSEEEEFTPPPRTGDLRNRIEFSSTKHWDDISDWYYSLIRKNSVSDGSVDAAARELVKVAKNDREKVRVILEYIQEQFRYVMMAFEENNLEPHNVDDVLRNRYGDCKDLSLLMVNMLKASGIKANIALFSLESDTSDPEDRLPSVSMFDHIVVEVEDAAGNYYVDPVLKGYDIGQYPVDYQGAYTFVITGLGGRFGRLPVLGEKKSYQRDIRSITIRPDGSAMVEWRSLYDLDSSVSVRKLWQGATDKGRRRFKEEMEGLLAAGGRVFENGFENIDAKYGTVTNAVKFERPGMYTLTGDIMVVDIEGFDRKEIFTRKERVKPIFYPYNSRADRRTIINIPEGFQVLHLPENFTENMGFFGLNRSFKNGAGRVDIYETEWYKRKEVPASDYKAIQGFLNDLAVKSRQQIILKRAE